MVKVYTMKSCGYCISLKEMLINDGIEFAEIDIDSPENSEEFKSICEITKSETVPIVKVGSRLLVPNVSFHTITDGYLLTKKLLTEVSNL